MSGLDVLAFLVPRARQHSFWLWVLNQTLAFTVPFNRPHGFKLLHLADSSVQTTALNKRANRNHIKGIHACAIATVAEFSSGFLLLMHLDPKSYRLIMSRLEVDYRFQAKQQIIATSKITADYLSRQVMEPLQNQDAVTIRMASDINDISGNEIAAAFTTWQVKRWDRVRTAL